MNEKGLRDWYESNHLKDVDTAISFMKEIDQLVITRCLSSLDHMSLHDLDQVIKYLIETKRNTVPYFVILMRYFKMMNMHEHFIHMTKYTGGLGVIESILNKLSKVVSKERSQELMSHVKIPVLGTPLHEITQFTNEFIQLLESKLDEKELRRVLADNHHQIPKEAFMQEKIYYEQAPSLEAYLKDLHNRKVAELTKHYEENKVWFEQHITPEVIAYVKQNQEVMSAVLEGDYLYITKIPYDTKAFLEAKTEDEKAYYLCHCPFAREVLKDNTFKISSNWCYCSGGFTKFPFDVIFDTDLPIEMLSSALRHDGACRFKIDLSGINYKKA
jgi:ferredoxin-fold anticodon binding domain-containing protein